jgi:hypothetical protein
MGCERGDRGLAVGAGDGQDCRCIALRLLQFAQRGAEQAEFGADVDPFGAGRGEQRSENRITRGDAGADAEQLDAVEQVDTGINRPAALPPSLHADMHHGLRQLGAQGLQLRRLAAAVGHAHHGTLARTPARHRQPGDAKAKNENGAVAQCHRAHRSFRLARPARHNIMVTIQKRITTCDSFTPSCSKWWCKGAILKMRRPWPYLRLVYLKYST